MNKSHKILILLFVAITLLNIKTYATVKLPSIFSDNMVLQQQTKAVIWGWADAGKIISVTPSWNKQKYSTTANLDGKWKIAVATPKAGGPYEIIISDGKAITLKNILIGEVWLCGGQSNMEMPMKGFPNQPVTNSNNAILHSENKNIRLFKVTKSSKTTPQDTAVTIGWDEANPESVSNFSAVGWYYGSLLQEMLHVPVGLISCNHGGSTVEAWMDEEVLKTFPDIKIPKANDTIKVVNQTPTTLYNAMLNPIIGYSIKGVIWYQGESNRNKYAEYEHLFPAMVNRWRKIWNVGEFPFYYVQIAPYKYPSNPANGDMNSAYIRDIQRKSLDKISNSAMAVLMDAGMQGYIHPADKKTPGIRLALLALTKTYGLKGFGAESPLYDTMTINEDVATVTFKNAPNGLTTFGQPLVNFEIAGEDKVFYPAKVTIEGVTKSGATIKVSTPEVKTPVAVRYAFKDFVKGELFNTEGLPASSFRTDNW